MYTGEAGTPERLELCRVFRERSKSYDFWIDNGLALVGSPDTVIRKIQEQHDLIGTTCCAPSTALAIWHRNSSRSPSNCSARRSSRPLRRPGSVGQGQ